MTDTAATEPLAIEIWSDVVCPWCYIGKRRVEQALERTGIPAEVRFRSFQLDPTAPRPGEPGHGESMRDVLGRKYGGNGAQMHQQVTDIAAGDGLEYHLDLTRNGNTGDAHRLLHLAVEHSLQQTLKERLMKAYFTEGRDVSDPEVLRTLATEAGLPADRVDAVLTTDAYAAEVAADIAQARAYGANGVPFTVVDGRYGVSGAQPLEVFEQTLRRAAADRAPITLVGAGESGATCDDSGCEIPPSR